jgi:hypothetical protein
MSQADTIFHSPPARPGSTTERLRRLMDSFPAGKIALGDVVDELGSAGTGLCLLLCSLTALIPGIAPVFGVALCAIALGMVLGHSQPYLPERLRRWQLDPDRLRSGIHRLTPAITWLERWLHPRAAHLLPRRPRSSGTRVTGVASLVNGVLIVLPIPFGNTAPAVAMLILSLGMVVGDGMAVSVGMLATVIALVIDIGMIALGYTAITGLWHSLF